MAENNCDKEAALYYQALTIIGVIGLLAGVMLLADFYASQTPGITTQGVLLLVGKFVGAIGIVAFATYWFFHLAKRCSAGLRQQWIKRLKRISIPTINQEFHGETTESASVTA